MASKTGTPGVAVLAGAMALWLVYAGVRDVPVFEGLRQLLRRQQPAARSVHAPFDPTGYLRSGAGAGMGAAGLGKVGDTGTERLVGNAAAAYPTLKALFPTLTMYGWRAQGSVPGSDHPRGLAIDVMTGSPLVHTQIIAAFVKLPGAKYWISQGKKASAPEWKIGAYTGPSPHTDHVHLSFA